MQGSERKIVIGDHWQRLLNVAGLLVGLSLVGSCAASTPPTRHPDIYRPGNDGLVEFEAELFHEHQPDSSSEWRPSETADFGGVEAMIAVRRGSGGGGGEPRLTYRVEFTEAGTYFLWVRGFASGRGADSLHVGVDGDRGGAVTVAFDGTDAWTWEQHTAGGQVATLSIGEPGTHTIDVWMREEGLAVDRIQLSPSAEHLPVPEPGAVLWYADHEEGNLDQWERTDTAFNCGGEFNSDGGFSRATDTVAHTGRYSAELVLENVSGSQGTRLFRGRCEDMVQSGGLYYGAWYYVPQVVRTPAGWWNIWQWKSQGAGDNTSEVMWVLDLLYQGDGTMELRLRDKHDGTSKYHRQEEPVPFPIGEWVHLEAFYLPSDNGRGKVVVWQDGRELFHIENVTTVRRRGDSRWSVNNYSADLQPDTVSIYVDDATISTEQVGPRLFNLSELASQAQVREE